MNRLNQFFRKVYSSPSLIWKAGIGLLFIVLGLAIIFYPAFANALSETARYSFSALLVFYGLFRLVTFYMEYKNDDAE
ncbi:MAG: DUF308 domain-containing protein [Bacteroidetes bacterium]|nr:DUF308 domain-containing protein [Bacteroidota bacterium]